MEKIKYPKRKHQTDMTSLAILFRKNPKQYQKIASAMRWVTAKK